MDKQRLKDHLNVLSTEPGIHWVDPREEEILQELLSRGLLLHSCEVYSPDLKNWYVTKFVHTKADALLDLTDSVTRTLEATFLEGDCVTVSFRPTELWGNPVELTGTLIRGIPKNKLEPNLQKSSVWEFKPFGMNMYYFVKEEDIYSATPRKPLHQRFRSHNPETVLPKKKL